jgi:hypothetical protein
LGLVFIDESAANTDMVRPRGAVVPAVNG